MGLEGTLKTVQFQPLLLPASRSGTKSGCPRPIQSGLELLQGSALTSRCSLLQRCHCTGCKPWARGGPRGLGVEITPVWVEMEVLFCPHEGIPCREDFCTCKRGEIVPWLALITLWWAQWCGSGILRCNGISGEQHLVLIFHFILFFLRAFLLVWLCELAPTCYQVLAFILWALIYIKPKSKR